MMSRDGWWRVLGIAVTLGAVAWLASCTEWVEVDVKTPVRGEAATNRLYVTQKLVQQLGASVAKPSNLSSLPPPQATLVLTSWYWDFMPERARLLKAWVEGGGHLVLYAGTLDNEQLRGWVPIQREDEADEDEDESPGATGPAASAPPAPPRKPAPRRAPCREVVETDGVPPAYRDDARAYRLCAISFEGSGLEMRKQHAPLWGLQGPNNTLMLRAAVGRGQVTVIEPMGLLDNDRVLEGDNALAVVAALQVRAGVPIWFVAEETRPPFWKWLWQQAWVAMLAGMVALAMALWRGAVRFGPLWAESAPGRRSIAEQISGTASFLRREGPEALLAAQIRALDGAARNHIRHYERMDRTQRAQAIAKATGQDAVALGLALDKRLARRRVDLPATLELLETARRLLLQSARSTPRR